MLDGVKQFMDTLGWQNQAFILLRNIKLSTFLLQLQLTMDGQAWANNQIDAGQRIVALSTKLAFHGSEDQWLSQC